MKSVENIKMHPDYLKEEHIGLEVHVNMFDTDPSNRKEGTLFDYDEDQIYVKINDRGKAKPFPYEGSAFKYVQQKAGLILDKLNDEEQRKKDEREEQNNIIRERRMERMLERQQEKAKDDKKKATAEKRKKTAKKKQAPKKKTTK